MHKLKTDRVDWRLIDDEVVALDLQTSEYLSINAAGGVLWPLLAEGADLEKLVDCLTAAYRMDRAAAQEDVSQFIEALSARGMLEST